MCSVHPLKRNPCFACSPCALCTEQKFYKTWHAAKGRDCPFFPRSEPAVVKKETAMLVGAPLEAKVDSGTSSHVFGSASNKQYLDLYSPSSDFVSVANGSSMRIAGRGNIQISTEKGVGRFLR